MSAHCIECRRPFGLLELTHETPDGELCEDCDASYPPTLRPSLGYVPALLRSVDRGDDHFRGVTKMVNDHDIADEPHRTTHEMVWVEAETTCAFPVQWVRWPNVKPREAAERRSGPRNNWSTR